VRGTFAYGSYDDAAEAVFAECILTSKVRCTADPFVNKRRTRTDQNL
jgi:hypothetical protein